MGCTRFLLVDMLRRSGSEPTGCNVLKDAMAYDDEDSLYVLVIDVQKDSRSTCSVLFGKSFVHEAEEISVLYVRVFHLVVVAQITNKM